MMIALIFLVSFFFGFSKCQIADNTTCYVFRMEMNITNNNGGDIHEVQIEIDTAMIVNEGYISNAECYDLEFKTDPSEEGVVDSKVNHWFQSECGRSTTTKIWLQLAPPLPNLETRTIYMYTHCNKKIAPTEDDWTNNGHFITLSKGCGGNWSPYEPFNGFFPKKDGIGSFGDVSGTAGVATHTHSYFGTTGATVPSYSRGQDGGGDSRMGSHYHEVNIVTNNAKIQSSPLSNPFPPHYSIPFCQNEKFDVEVNQVLFFDIVDDGSLDLSVWETISELHGKFFLGGTNYQNRGGAENHFHYYNDLCDATPTAEQKLVPGGTPSVALPGHQHAVRGVTDWGSSIPLHHQVVLGNSKIAHTILKDAIVMAKSQPPLGFEEFTSLDGAHIRGSSSRAYDMGWGNHNHGSTSNGVHLSILSGVAGAGSGSPPFNTDYVNHAHANITGNDFSTEDNNDILPSFYVNYYKMVVQTTTISYGELIQIREMPPNNTWWVVLVIALSIIGSLGAAIFIGLIVIVIIVGVFMFLSRRAKRNFDQKVMDERFQSAEKATELDEQKEKLENERANIRKQSERERSEKKKMELKLKKMEQENTQLKKKTSFRKLKGKIKKVKFADVKVVKEVGKGHLGFTLNKAEWKGNEVLFRIFNPSVFQTKKFNIFDFFEKELKEYSELQHPNILRYFAYNKPPKVGVVTEYASNGTLKSYILRRKKRKPMSFKEKVNIFSQIAKGMNYLHSHEFPHKDLRPENIFLTEKFVVKIDFGFNRTFNKNNNDSQYAAPELVDDRDEPEDDDDKPPHEKFAMKCDVYSFAFIMYEIVTETFLKNVKGIAMKRAKNPEDRPKLKAKYFPGFIVNLINMCWNDDAESRPSFSRINQIIENVKDL